MMKIRPLLVAVAIAVVAPVKLWAAEQWACNFPAKGDSPIFVVYSISMQNGKQVLTETWPDGRATTYDLKQNNKNGVVGVSTNATSTPDGKIGDVGFEAIAIDARTGVALHASARTVAPQLAEVHQGKCVHQ